MEKKGSGVVVAAHVSQATEVDSFLKNHFDHGAPIGAVVKIDESGQTTVTPIGKDARLKYSFESELTFTPKLNETSLKLAKERGRRWKESYASRQAAQIAEQESVFTFKPRVSIRSEQIAQRLNSTFHSRQQRHLERRQQMMEHLPQQRTRLEGRQHVHTLPKTLSVSHMHPSISSELHPHIRSPSKSLCNIADTVTSSSSRTTLAPVELPIDIQEKTINVKLHVRQMYNQERKMSDKSYQTTVEKSPYLASVLPHKKTSNSEKHHRNLSCPVSSQSNGDSSKSPQESHPHTKSTPSSPPRHSDNNVDIYQVKRAREAASTAIRGKKVFLCLGPYTPIRQSLRRRGWVEKNYKGPLGAVKLKKKQKPKSSKQLKLSAKISDDLGNESDLSSSSDSDSDSEMVDQLVQAYREEFNDDGEYTMMSRSVRLTYPHFVWTCKRDDIEFRFLKKDQIVSHYQQAVSFTTKVGLCKNLRNLVWFADTDPNTFFPRCYRLCVDEEKKRFIDDFRLTAAIGILKWFVDNPHRRTSSAVSGQYIHSEGKLGKEQDNGDGKDVELSGVVPGRAASLAVTACKEFISTQEHDDIDVPLSTPSALSENDWNDLIQFSYQLTQEQGILSTPEVNYNTIIQLLEELKDQLPQFELDGLRNIWIIKPGAKSRGRGIFCLDRLEPILDLVSSTVQKKESKLIIQKYIERPLLIYDTKFDIRQWFLVTDWNPLTLWVYKKCYLRFSTQLFTLDKLDQSVHLCNNSIQKYYENAPRASELPEDNMWDNEQFEEFLEACGAGKVWGDVIYPGMKEALVGVLLTTQDDMDLRKNSFELFGADFMITEDYRPWLIEVNSSPAMSASASVTAKLCPQVMEDTLKVVLDRRHDKTADVGFFELAYKQTYVSIPTYLGMQLVVEGHQINSNRQSHKHSFGSNSSRPQSSFSVCSPYPVTLTQVNSDSDNDNETKDSQLSKELPGLSGVACQPMNIAPELQHVPVQQQRFRQKKGIFKRNRVAHMAQVCLRTLSMNKTHSGDLAVLGAQTGRQNRTTKPRSKLDSS